MMQAMNTGHDGSLTTVHANSTRDALARLETMVLMAGLELPLRPIREQMVSALHLIVHIRRYEDGVRESRALPRSPASKVLRRNCKIFSVLSGAAGAVQPGGRVCPDRHRPAAGRRTERGEIEIPVEMFQPSQVNDNAS